MFVSDLLIATKQYDKNTSIINNSSGGDVVQYSRRCKYKNLSARKQMRQVFVRIPGSCGNSERYSMPMSMPLFANYRNKSPLFWPLEIAKKGGNSRGMGWK